MIIEIATDGSSWPNPGPGGWCAVFRMGRVVKAIYGFEHSSTNNRMELTAAIKALEHLKKPCEVKITTDSKYLQNGITKWIHKWKQNNYMTVEWKYQHGRLVATDVQKPVKNDDLWKALDKATERHVIVWDWVRGHQEHQDNLLCDRLAGEARTKKKAGLLDLTPDGIVIPVQDKPPMTAEQIEIFRSITLED